MTGISSDGAAAVDYDVKWRRIDKNTPQGVKVQLINKWSGVAHYGVLPQGRDFFDHWAPMPTFEKDAK